MGQIGHVQAGAPAVVSRCNLLYADDVLCALAHKGPAAVTMAARDSAEVHEKELTNRGLKTKKGNAENFTSGPDLGEEGIFRRAPMEMGENRGMGKEKSGRSAETGAVAMDYRDGGEKWILDGMGRQLSYSTVARIKILGVVFDRGLSCEDHLNRVLDKAKPRLAVLSKVFSFSWGLESGMIRVAGNALIISQLRYGLTVIGSGLSEKGMRLIDTRVVNAPASRIRGMGPSPRIPILHAVAGADSTRNLYKRNCAEMLNRAV